MVSIKRSASDRARSKGKSKRRPPWGNILGGKPIPRSAWNFNAKIDLGETAQILQYVGMLRLKDYYGIAGRVPPYPVAGVANADWLPWYQLALAIACDLDDSLKIIDPKPLGKTAPRWRGLPGRIFLDLIDAHHSAFPKRSVRWCIAQVRKRVPAYGEMSLEQLVVRYHEAKRHHRATKRARIRKITS
jgi:hypothetical protein